MKFIPILVIFLLCFAGSCEKIAKTELKEVSEKVANEKVEAKKLKGRPYMTFVKSSYDLGAVKRGEKRELVYTYTNTGDVPLEIDIISACECTTLDYSTKPVPPGGKGTINAIFDSTEKEESETIDITIVLKNTDPVLNYPIVEEVKYNFDLIEK